LAAFLGLPSNRITNKTKPNVDVLKKKHGRLSPVNIYFSIPILLNFYFLYIPYRDGNRLKYYYSSKLFYIFTNYLNLISGNAQEYFFSSTCRMSGGKFAFYQTLLLLDNWLFIKVAN